MLSDCCHRISAGSGTFPEVDSCTTTGDLDYPGTAYEVRVPGGDEILHVVVDGAGEQQVLFLGPKKPVRIPLELLEQILAQAKEVVKHYPSGRVDGGQTNMTGKRINIELSNDQALVLFDWLVRFNKHDDNDFDDQAEQRVLWDMEAMLEKSLDDLFSDNYKELLAEARARVRDQVEA